MILALILFIRSPWGQGIIVDKAVTFLEDKTGADVEIERLFITFSGNIYLDNFYISDVNGDTLAYSRELEAGIAFVPLIKNGAIHVSNFEWDGLKVRVKRPEESGVYNFQFIIDAFSSGEEEVAETPPEEESPQLDITLSPISLRNFDIQFKDEVLGIEASILLGDFELAIPELDLNKYEFGIGSVLLSDTEIKYIQTKPLAESEETEEESIMPLIKLDELTLNNINLNYENQVDQQQADVFIQAFSIGMPKLDLAQQIVEINEVSLAESSILYHDFSPSPATQENTSASLETEEFAWPDWKVNLSKITLSENNLEYKTVDLPSKKGEFNPEVILLNQLNLEGSDISLDESSAKLLIEKFQLQEGSGFELKDLNLDLEIDQKALSISKFLIETNRSKLNLNSEISYSSIQNLINKPDQSNLALDVNEYSLDLRDGYFFAPELARDTLIQEIARNPLQGELVLSGNLSEIEIPKFIANWGESSASARGNVSNVMNTDSLYFDLPEIHLKSNRETINRFANESDFGIQYPNEIELKAKAKGSLADILADLDLMTDLGNVTLAANYQNTDQIAFDLDLQLNELQLGTILQNPDLDTLSLGLKAKGSGNNINDLNASLSSNFEKLKLYGSDYSGLQLDGELNQGKGDINLNLDSEYLKFDLISFLDLDTTNSIVKLNLDLKGADFQQLGFSAKESRAKLVLDVNFEGNPEDFTVDVSLHDGLVLYEDKTFPIGVTDIQAMIKPDSTSVTLKSKLADGYLKTNTNPSALSQALSNHFLKYLGQEDSTQVALDSSIVMDMDFSIYEDPLLNEFLLQGLEQLDSGRIQLAYFQDSDSLTAKMDFPFIDYAGSEIDSLGLDLISNPESLNLEFGFLSLTSGPLNMDKTLLSGEMKDSRIYFDFSSYEKDSILFHVASDIGLVNDTVSVHLNPENLIFKKTNWSIPASNQVLLSDSYIDFQDFSFTQKSQELTIENNIEGFTDENIAVLFKNFRLSTLTSLLNPEEIIAGGKMEGQLVIENPFGATGLMGELQIDSLKATGVSLGDLSLEASAKSLGNYILALQLRDDGIDLDVNGQFIANESGGEFDMQLDLIQVEMKKIAQLSQGQILDASGYLKGNVTANGTTNDPIYKGEFQFHETSFVPAELSTKYLLSNETITADNQGIYLSQFTVKDADNNTFIVDGSILTNDFTNPEFDLTLLAKNFMVVNSTDKDNELVYGRGTIDADVSIKGDLNLPIVRAKLNVRESTDLSLLIPESQLDIVERDGVVLFVNKENPDDILTGQTEETTTAFSGYDIQAQLTADPKAKFTVIIDPKTGDNLLVSGSANLQMDINPNGRITLSGGYEITEGHYEMSLYNLISKKFIINQGSRIVWNGDPMDASMDIQAIYEVDASASALMATQISGSSQSTQTQYQRRLPFLVYLNVDGELLKPEISFTLDMPENERGAFGGNVYSQVLQINDQEDELNKQVFSLLVLNRFFPSQGSDGSNGGAEAIARNSASQVLSDQMNALSSKLFGDSGFQLGFDVDTYQDYQSGSAQNRTDLNINAQQTLFNDRLVVEVGSQVGLEGSSQDQEQTNSILANVSFEYMLTEDRRWRVRVFRKNQFESIIDGQLIVTGGGLIFNREFNEFNELWNKPEEEEEAPTIEEKKEDDEN
ncbi:translocation/assembly module TamB domain-containing protein [Algoriphagus machipongonensis]|uniref:translocation/assembly module TamB domain-containing protein n=1 Tax=Algoriphagus machipongonensis TaxID=388413 RepID=UPI001ED930F1|nr:translocation/assembly module TamB domain-containing protein [Algoriphagus machipongonensis]